MNDIDATEIVERTDLAVLTKVERLEKINGKDFVEIVYLTDIGYTVICQKGHHIGDWVLFVKYDTIVPECKMFEFLRENKFRIKSKAFTEKNEDGEVAGKFYSQGVVIPIKEFMDYMNSKDMSDKYKSFEICQDVTEDIGVKKYIMPVKNSGSSFGAMECKGSFPTHLCNKTDEINLSSKKKVLEELKGKLVVIRQKMEGSSGTCYYDENEFNVCTRNNNIRENESNKFWQAVNKHNLKEKMKDSPYILQWELMSPGCQKNKLKLDEPDMYVFNIIEKSSRRLLSDYEMIDICKTLEIPICPLVGIYKNFSMSFDEIQLLADAQIYSSGELAEGIVIRPVYSELSNVLRSTLSVKCINRNYKL